MTEFNPDDLSPRKSDVVVLHTVQPHHALMKANRILITLVFTLIIVVFVMGLVFIPRQNLLDGVGHPRTDSGISTHNPTITAEINTLKNQMFGLVSGSIDSKLRSLEDNIRRGSVGESLETLQDLKSEVKMLGSYTQANAAIPEPAVTDQKVIKELSELKGLLYLTIVSCGLMIAAMGGIWLKQRHRITHQKPKAYLHNKE